MLSDRQRDIFWNLIQANVLGLVMTVIVFFRIESGYLWMPILVTIFGLGYQLIKLISVIIDPISSGFMSPYT